MASYDTIVIGGGVNGCSAAYHLATSQARVLLLEQFSLGHGRGSSHGHSRITRKTYPQEFYAKMMIEAYAQWEELEREFKQQLFVPCGLLNIGAGDGAFIQSCRKSLDAINSPYEVLAASQVSQRYPSIRLPSQFVGLYDPEAGVLKADKCLHALQAAFRARGGCIQDEEPVLSIHPAPDVITLTTSRATYRCRSLIITAGPWAGKLLQPLGLQLPLSPERIKVLYWKEKHPGHEASKFPTLIIDGLTTNAFPHSYGLPCLEYPGHVKMCVHNGPTIDPDLRDATSHADDDADEKCLGDMISKHFPGIEDKPAIRDTCIYTTTPDQNFVIDTHPYWKNIVIGAGFSGHGFKLGPVTGKLLAELATGRTPSYDLSPFSIQRFLKSKPAAKL